MSFVSKILENSGELERRAVHKDMETLIQKQRQLQLEVHQLAENKFSHFHPTLMDSQKLNQQVADVRKQMTVLEDKINDDIKGQLSLSTAEFQSLSQQLTKSKLIGESLTYLNNIYKLHESCVEAINTKKYTDAIVALDEADALLKQSFCDVKLNICVTLKNEFFVLRLKVEQEMADMWSNCICWSFPKDESHDTENKNDTSVLSTSLTIKKAGVYKSTLQQLIQGLHMTNLLSIRMKHFSEKFQKYIVPLILEQRDVEIEMQSGEDSVRLVIGLSSQEAMHPKKGNVKRNVQSTITEIDESKLYITVFDRVLKVLGNLNDMILGIKFEDRETSTLMQLLGTQTSEKLLDILQREILAKAVPTSAKDLEGFDKVKNAACNLHEELISFGYIRVNYQGLKESVENVNMLFSNKKCALIMEEARELMTSDLLHPTTSVEKERHGDLPQLISTKGGAKGKKPVSLSEKCLSDDTFKMPDCQISQNVVSLMELAYATLQEATESSADCAIQMYITVHEMFELFSHVVPAHHCLNIEKLPQMSALHHNNCMYIAHHLMTLGHQFALALPSSETITFVSLIQHIRDSGNDSLLAQIKRQQVILLECMDQANGFSNLESEENCKACDRSIKQVLHQLHHLHNVWHPVLPINLYHKAMGKLIQCIVARITDDIIALEDITEEACQKLTTVLSPLDQECSQIMEVEAAVLPCYVQNWSKLTNVKTILNSRLLDIEKLWSDGMGPLSLTFSPIELKQIIRALFQNTDRRSDLLSKIK